MSRDVYTGLAGARASLRQMEVISNNVANSGTVGFRASKVAFSLEGSGEGVLGKSQAIADSERLNTLDGGLMSSKNPTHMAIQGDGYFVVDSGGEELLTRAGAFRTDEEGNLLTATGAAVMGEGGPVVLPEGEFTVASNGDIRGADGEVIDTLKILTANDLEPVGQNLYRATSGLRAGDAEVFQGSLEQSNTDPMHAMVELIEASRYFEACQKVMQTSNDMDERINRSGGR